MDRKTFMKDVYSKYWIKERKAMGFIQYDRNLCNYICKNVPTGSKLLEVAIGTGYPIADFLQKTGYEIYGVDISSDLIEECGRLNPNIKCEVGDAENLYYTDNSFDCVYCFHSTWYFPNLNVVIDEMLRVARSGGVVIFDIENLNNKKIAEGYRKRVLESAGARRAIRVVKNFINRIFCVERCLSGVLLCMKRQRPQTAFTSTLATAILF
ncbi:MAG: class I SAM-dependent methyltransferase [Candidatus Verstraetearchaeota archaeon]|nr:class I SAM-dependent methyltransferase [Candidatus Verstraetearchaeota archaeon]